MQNLIIELENFKYLDRLLFTIDHMVTVTEEEEVDRAWTTTKEKCIAQLPTLKFCELRITTKVDPAVLRSR